MRFYTSTHTHYCGIEPHAKTMYLCILDRDGEVLLHENRRSRPEEFLAAVKPFREDLVVSVECIFTWYWLADLGRREGIEFVLGHALYMKAIHGGKAKNDKVDAFTSSAREATSWPTSRTAIASTTFPSPARRSFTGPAAKASPRPSPSPMRARVCKSTLR